jgi:cell division protein FtsA
MELKKTGHYDRICSIILYGDGLSYFENINKFVRTIIERKTKIVTKMDLGLKNSENITSLALAKEVYDRFNLLEDNDKTKIVEEVQTNETEFLLDENEGRSPILERIKTFLGKIF